MAMTVRSGFSAERSVTPTVGYPPELLVILMDEGSRVAGDIADRRGRDPVAIGQAVEAAADQDSVDRRAWAAQERPESIRAVSSALSGGQDLLFGRLGEPARRTPRPRRSIEQPNLTFGSITADPLVGGGLADPELFGHMSHRPTLAHNAGHQELATENGQFRLRMCHESPPSAWSFLTPQTEHEDSRSVNNVCGDYS
jgi:hypothetical protein